MKKAAYLSRTTEFGCDDMRDSQVEIGCLKNNEGGVASQLKLGALHVSSGGGVEFLHKKTRKVK